MNRKYERFGWYRVTRLEMEVRWYLWQPHYPPQYTIQIYTNISSTTLLELLARWAETVLVLVLLVVREPGGWSTQLTRKVTRPDNRSKLLVLNQNDNWPCLHLRVLAWEGAWCWSHITGLTLWSSLYSVSDLNIGSYRPRYQLSVINTLLAHTQMFISPSFRGWNPGKMLGN